MGVSDRVLRRDHDVSPSVALRWDRDRPVVARRGDTVSLALFDDGIFETSRSAKYRRPRGAYCLRGDCGTCLVRINGLPNRRACLTTVQEGMKVEGQNRIAAGADPTALVDTMLRGDMDHHHFMVRPRVVNQVMQGIARNLAGLGTLPDRVPDEPARHEEHRPAVLLVGAGPAGRAAFAALAASGLDLERDLVWIDRLDRAGLQTEAGHPLPDSLLDHTGVFGVYPQERLWAAVSDRPGETSVLRSIDPRHVILATGARDPILVLPNNDRPGVVSARGLVGQLRRARARLNVDAVLIGEGDHVPALAEALGLEAIAPDRVRSIEGSPVDGVVLADGERSCRFIAMAPRPAPAFDLGRQAGATVRWGDGGFALVHDDEGRCMREPWSLWAAGDVTGFQGPQAAAIDGERVALAVVRALATSSQ